MMNSEEGGEWKCEWTIIVGTRGGEGRFLLCISLKFSMMKI